MEIIFDIKKELFYINCTIYIFYAPWPIKLRTMPRYSAFRFIFLETRIID